MSGLANALGRNKEDYHPSLGVYAEKGCFLPALSSVEWPTQRDSLKAMAPGPEGTPPEPALVPHAHFPTLFRRKQNSGNSNRRRALSAKYNTCSCVSASARALICQPFMAGYSGEQDLAGFLPAEEKKWQELHYYILKLPSYFPLKGKDFRLFHRIIK